MTSYLYRRIKDFRRRQSWCFSWNPKKLLNLIVALWDFAWGSSKSHAYPPMVKIDTTPLCPLRCTVCVHADYDRLPPQRFTGDMKMSMDMYRSIIDEIGDYSFGVSLYYLGDPFMHPQILEMCSYAKEQGVATHISSACSFRWSDKFIDRIVDSGLTHLTVCIDGITQESFGATRVGGRIEWVLDNLHRILQARARKKSLHPIIEVQYIKFIHNAGELEEARRMLEGWGVDDFWDFWGSTHNYADQTRAIGEPLPKKRPPRCFEPWFVPTVKWDGDVLPCCHFRLAMQYSPGRDCHTIGNIKDGGLLAMWHSPEYERIRDLVANAPDVGERPEYKHLFCKGCHRLFSNAKEAELE